VSFVKRHAVALFIPLFLLAIGGGVIATTTSLRTLGVVLACVGGLSAFVLVRLTTGQVPYTDPGTNTFGHTHGPGGDSN
jgi:hypothetical protein